MKRKRFSEEQIVGILREHEAGVSTADLGVSDAQKLRGLEAEIAKLKRPLADAMLDNVALKDLLGKKW